MRGPTQLTIETVAARRWFTTQEASKLLGISPSSTMIYFDSGVFTGQRTPGGHRRISRESLLGYARGRGIDVPGLTRMTRRVLVVDDEEPIRRLIKRGLEDKGLPIEVVTVQSAEEAIAKLAGGVYDLVLLDWVFPTEMQGPQVLAWIQENVRARGVPVFGISGKIRGDGGENWFLRAGAVGFLEKPFRIERLKDAIWPYLFAEKRGKAKPKRPAVEKRRRIDDEVRDRRRA